VYLVFLQIRHVQTCIACVIQILPTSRSTIRTTQSPLHFLLAIFLHGSQILAAIISEQLLQIAPLEFPTPQFRPLVPSMQWKTHSPSRSTQGMFGLLACSLVRLFLVSCYLTGLVTGYIIRGRFESANGANEFVIMRTSEKVSIAFIFALNRQRMLILSILQTRVISQISASIGRRATILLKPQHFLHCSLHLFYLAQTLLQVFLPRYELLLALDQLTLLLFYFFLTLLDM